MAVAKGEDRLPSDVLVFISRAIQNGDRELLGQLVDELGRRIARIAVHWAQGFDQDTTDEIVWGLQPCAPASYGDKTPNAAPASAATTHSNLLVMAIPSNNTLLFRNYSS